MFFASCNVKKDVSKSAVTAMGFTVENKHFT